MAEVVIRLDNVIKTYDMGDVAVHALRGLSFTIEQGELVSIMGPSGSGKSTCMNMIGCLDRPTSGIVEICGKQTAKMNEKELAFLRNKTIGFVFQQYHLLNSLTVIENVMLPLRYQGLPRASREEPAMEALKLVGLEDRINHRPSELSGGQKQRVAIARAMVTKPHIILADEPTGALDSETGKVVLELFRAINKKGTTVVIVTHDPKIGSSTERCIKLFDGQLESANTKKRKVTPKSRVTGKKVVASNEIATGVTPKSRATGKKAVAGNETATGVTPKSRVTDDEITPSKSKGGDNA
jgi:putative ABC transport system ATP-binding protein